MQGYLPEWKMKNRKKEQTQDFQNKCSSFQSEQCNNDNPCSTTSLKTQMKLLEAITLQTNKAHV